MSDNKRANYLVGETFMNSKERVLNAMYGKEVDRVPVSWYTHFSDQTDNTVADQLTWLKNTGMDMLCIETDGFMQWDCGNTPINTPEALRAMRPHKKDDWYIEGQIDRAKRIAEGAPDKAISYMIFTPFGTVKHSLNNPRQEEEVMELYRADKEAFAHAMAVIEEDNFTVMERLKAETDIVGIFVSLQNCERDRFSPEEYEEVLTPWDKRLIAKANSLYDTERNIYHMCSWRGVPNNIDIWQKYDYKTVNWAVAIEELKDGRKIGVKEGRDYFKAGSTLMAGFDNRPCGILYTGNEKEIKDYTKEIIRSAGKEKLILCSDCSVQKDTPDEHLRWVVEAAEELG
ncbi:MAG: hypothetical protein E7332_02235 [Clostridiales bacterium]|nr:hypothetical protein [Clostridiales bacterium]